MRSGIVRQLLTISGPIIRKEEQLRFQFKNTSEDTITLSAVFGLKCTRAEDSPEDAEPKIIPLTSGKEVFVVVVVLFVFVVIWLSMFVVTAAATACCCCLLVLLVLPCYSFSATPHSNQARILHSTMMS